MLDRLRGRDRRRMEHCLVGDVARDFIGFLDDAVERRAINLFWLLAMHLEDSLEPGYLSLGLAQMLFESRLELGIGRLFDWGFRRLETDALTN